MLIRSILGALEQGTVLANLPKSTERVGRIGSKQDLAQEFSGFLASSFPSRPVFGDTILFHTKCLHVNTSSHPGFQGTMNPLRPQS